MTDSDWATCPETRRSRSGGGVFWGRHCLQHWCKAQDRIARSSGEAEVKACCKAISELLGLRNAIEFLLHKPIRLEMKLDATAAKGIAHRQGAGQLKHLDVRVLWIQECILMDKIQVTKIPREENWADQMCSVPKPRIWWEFMSGMGMTFAPGLLT